MATTYMCPICKTANGCQHGPADDSDKGKPVIAKCRANTDAKFLDLIKYGHAISLDGEHVPYETTLKDMTMTLAILSTEIGSYTVPEHLVKHWRNTLQTKNIPATLDIYNAMGERIQSFGEVGVVPSIWTHAPVPLGFPLEAVHKQFEERVVVVLGNGEPNTPSLLKCGPDMNIIYKDNRYYCDGVRMAWMMYLDRALTDRG